MPASDFTALVQKITPEIYQSLKQAVELGKWKNSEPLTAEQVEYCLQAIIVYEHQNVESSERTAYVPPKKHEPCELASSELEQPIKWRNKPN